MFVVLHVAVFTGTSAKRPVSPHSPFKSRQVTSERIQLTSIQLHILLHSLLDICNRYMAAMWQQQAVVPEHSHRVSNVCQLVCCVSPNCRHARLRTIGAGGGAPDSRRAAAWAAAHVACTRAGLSRCRAELITLPVLAGMAQGPAIANSRSRWLRHEVQDVCWQQQQLTGALNACLQRECIAWGTGMPHTLHRS
jgi:hypothetical protein